MSEPEAQYATPTPVPVRQPAAGGDLVDLHQYAASVDSLVRQMAMIREAMDKVMVRGEDYGYAFPGAPKPSLLKPGAEKLCLLFRMDPQYEVISETQDGQHLSLRVCCTLYHIPTSQRLGSGLGMCSTKESKYAFRESPAVCPKCGKDAIIRSKEKYGGGWLCFKKRGGCGERWPNGSTEIESQQTGRVPNEDLADQYNTVLNMADKRALIAAVRVVTAASAIFSQDLPEDEGAGERLGARRQERGRSSSQSDRQRSPGAPPPDAPLGGSTQGEGQAEISPERKEFFEELQRQDALWIWPHYCKVGNLKNREDEDRQIRQWRQIADFATTIRDLVKLAAEKGWIRSNQKGTAA